LKWEAAPPENKSRSFGFNGKKEAINYKNFTFKTEKVLATPGLRGNQPKELYIRESHAAVRL